jgi:hypothetical protein
MNERTPQLAFAKLPQEGKDDDAGTLRSLGDRYLLAVADGLTHHSGRIAAQEAIAALEGIETIPADARSLFERFRAVLPGSGDSPESQTTLTCGILSVEERGEALSLVLDFFAIGDSPVWRVVRGPAGDRYAFQRYALHGAPYPAETSKVYGTVRPHHPESIQGAVSFGRAEISADDVLVICTDGIPERDVFVRDRAQTAAADAPPYLCDWLFGRDPYENAALERVLRGYASRGVLYDDATIIAVRMAVPSIEAVEEPRA